MISISTGALQLRKRLTTSLPSVALAASTLVGGATLLSGGQAQAFSCTFINPNPTPPPATGGTCANFLDQWIDTNDGAGNPYPTDKQIWFKQLPTAGNGGIEFKWIDANPNNTPDLLDQWHVDADFNADLNYLNGQSDFDYIMRIVSGPPYGKGFKDVYLNSMITPPPAPPLLKGGKVTKQVFLVNQNGSTNPVDWTKGAPITSLLTNVGQDDIYGDLIWVSDTAIAYPAGTDPSGVPYPAGTVDAYQNAFTQVPGPLPILGAGAAFGYTRKLRRRVKAFRMG